MCVPAPATLGLNVPLLEFVIPVPLQVPPVVAADKFTDEWFKQNGPAGFMVASGVSTTIIIAVVIIGS